jgi:hypothetical protein
MKLFNLYDFEESHENDSVILGWWHTFSANSFEDLPDQFILEDSDGNLIPYSLHSRSTVEAKYLPDDGISWIIVVYS